MRILNEFKTNDKIEIKNLVVKDLSTKIGWILSSYPSKIESETNLDLLFKHFSFLDPRNSSTDTKLLYTEYVLKSEEIFEELVKILPISTKFFGEHFPNIKYYCFEDGTSTYTIYI